MCLDWILKFFRLRKINSDLDPNINSNLDPNIKASLIP